MPPGASYPDISDLIERKTQARRERARMPFGEKIVILEKMRRELLPLREAMRRARETPPHANTELAR